MSFAHRLRGCARVCLCLAVLSDAALAQRGQGANTLNDPSGVLGLGALAKSPADPIERLPAMPENFPGDLLPAGSKFIAGSSAPSLVVLVVEVPPAVIAEPWRYQWSLEDRGWISWTPGRFGFAPVSTGAAGRIVGVPGLTNAGMSVQVCKGQEFADISLWRLAEGPRYLRPAVGPDARRSCAARPFGAFTDVPLPSLEVPIGVRTNGSGGGGGLDDTEARTRLDLSSAPAGTSPETLAKEFVRQMQTAGWTLEGGPSGDGVMTAARMSGKSRAGDPVTALVVVTALTDTPFVDAVVRVVRNKPVR